MSVAQARMFPVTVDALTKALSFAEERNRIIANNIANANTPFYKARRAPVAEFQKALSQAIEKAGASAGTGLRLSGARGIREVAGGLEITPSVKVTDASSPLRHDENNVSLEKEMTALAENTLMYRTLADLLRKQFGLLRLATRDRLD